MEAYKVRNVWCLPNPNFPFRNYGWNPLHTAIDGVHKYIQAPRPEFYNLELDPQETANLTHSEGERTEALSRWLTSFARVRIGKSAHPSRPTLGQSGLSFC